jgi:cholesterol oxidase
MAEPLSSRWDTRAQEYDVIVIGSGYGGAITAARIASADISPKPTLCVLERGMEWIPGTFPDEPLELLDHFLSPLNPLGLYEFHRSDDISVIKGSGLGGTSLVNANVAIIPEDAVFNGNHWPANIKIPALRKYYERAASTLQVSRHPRGEQLLKVQALKKRAAEADRKFELLKIAVNFDREGVDENGVERHKCIDCGDCVTGCNVRAKNTLYMNYLPIAKNRGATLFTQVRARHVEPHPGGGWRVHYERFAPRNPIPERGWLHARRMLVLSAGSVNSTEILLRSRDHGLALPDTIGTKFSGNGDFFGIAYNNDVRTDILGFGNHLLDDPERSAVKAGPTIVGVIRCNLSKPLDQQMTFEDLSVPRAAVDVCRRILPLLPGTDTDNRPIHDLIDNLKEAQRALRDLRFNPEGALNHTMAYLVMAQDDARGTIRLKDDSPSIAWPNVGDLPIFKQINAEVLKHAKMLGGKFVGDPIWKFLNKHHLITAHPLGGCPMGDTAQAGVVDEFGQVFQPDGRKHAGLYVADGSLVPTALGVNPFLTISALSERIADHLIAELRQSGV